VATVSTLRPTLRKARAGEPSLGYKATYHRVFEAVKARRRLAHGTLHDGDLSCAIGAYFDESSIAIDSRAIEEIAAYNDSFPRLCAAQRWRKVSAWLQATVRTLYAKPTTGGRA
jgi:hypothetical protein